MARRPTPYGEKIVVKTRMLFIPICCSRCRLYQPSFARGKAGGGICGATIDKGWPGRRIDVRVSEGRPEWCPLLEREEKQCTDRLTR